MADGSSMTVSRGEPGSARARPSAPPAHEAGRDAPHAPRAENLVEVISAVAAAVEEVKARLARLEERMSALCGGGDSPLMLVDLASCGRGEPDALVAATLDRSVFPRLVTTMEDDDAGTPSRGSAEVPSCNSAAPGAEALVETPGITARNLLNEWHVAMHDGDLPACRRLYGTLVDTVPPDDLAPLRELLDALGRHVERLLREGFAACVRGGDCRGALSVGERLAELFPGRDAAEQFARLRPHLLRRLGDGGDQPSASIDAR